MVRRRIIAVDFAFQEARELMHRGHPTQDETLLAGSTSERSSHPATAWRTSRRRLIQVAAGTAAGLWAGGLVQARLTPARPTSVLAQGNEHDGHSGIAHADRAPSAA